MPKLHGTTNTSDKTALVAWCRQRPIRQGAASSWHALTPMNSRSMFGCDGSYPSTPTTARATALDCVLSGSNPNPRAAFGMSCLMHCCHRPTFSVQRLSKPNRLVSANISTRSCLMRLPAATAEPPRWSSAMVVPSLCARSLLAGALPLWAGSVVVSAVVAWPACD